MRPRPPLPFVVVGVLGVLFLALPLIGLIIRAPWSSLRTVATEPVVVDALRLSMVASIAATVVSAVIGVPLAWLLARVDFPGRSIVRGLVLLPLVLPPVVGGAALLFALGRRGFVGAPIERVTGFVLPFSIWGVIVAATFVAMPFLVLTVEAALRDLDGRYERAAASLGANRWVVLRRVTLPMIAPSIAAGLTLTWARALGEFGATITFAGNLQGRTQTLPLAVFVALERDRGAAVVMSLLMIAVAMVILVGLRDRWRVVR